MDIHEKSVDMDMDMDAIFHIHGNPVLFHVFCSFSSFVFTLSFCHNFAVHTCATATLSLHFILLLFCCFQIMQCFNTYSLQWLLLPRSLGSLFHHQISRFLDGPFVHVHA